MDSEPLDYPISIEQGERSAARVQVTVSHDLGDRTLVVVILLAAIIGACGVVIGLDLSERQLQSQYMRDVAVKLQINTNHVDEVANELKILKETRHAKQ